jgi:hypothetical protein
MHVGDTVYIGSACKAFVGKPKKKKTSSKIYKINMDFEDTCHQHGFLSP